MTIELASVAIKQKPWGNTDLRPWNGASTNGKPAGELWFQRSCATTFRLFDYRRQRELPETPEAQT